MKTTETTETNHADPRFGAVAVLQEIPNVGAFLAVDTLGRVTVTTNGAGGRHCTTHATLTDAGLRLDYSTGVGHVTPATIAAAERWLASRYTTSHAPGRVLVAL